MEYCGIFYEYINFDPSSPFNQLRFSHWYDAILVGGSYMAHPWGVVMRPTLYFGVLCTIHLEHLSPVHNDNFLPFVDKAGIKIFSAELFSPKIINFWNPTIPPCGSYFGVLCTIHI